MDAPYNVLNLIIAWALLMLSTTATHSCRGARFGSVAVDESFVSWDDFTVSSNATNELQAGGGSGGGGGGGGRVIVVSNDGSGDSTTVQGAVDMVPDGNKERVKILVSPGVYREKVIIPITKPYISLIGEGGSARTTVVSWHLRASDSDANGRAVGTFYSASFAVESDYFCAHGITFENTAPGASPGEVGKQAVALRLSGDKAMLYKCSILGSQDTLFDHSGRHYFFECYIEGSIDFIFGNARSLYQDCRIHAVAITYGAVAASQRDSPSDDSGFSFLNCRLTGSGMNYLGRAWGRYARVIYSYCEMDGIITPEGWSDWGDPSRTRTVWFGEYNCRGKGADLSRRVSWARSLSYDEARPFLDRNFIDGEQWLKL